MKRIFFQSVTIIFLLFYFSKFSFAQNNTEPKMQWFKEAKFGVFIHWGIYSVNGISESWSFFNNYIPYEKYKMQLNGFTAKNYHPDEWVNLIKESGAKYAVITTKHHDGISLWDTKQPNAISIPKHSAAKKDVINPFVSALKKSGLKTGLYYSLPDWSYADYDIFTKEIKKYDYKKEPQRFNKFVNYYQNQLKELSAQYKPDLLWFDGDWEHTGEEWEAAETRKLLKSYNQNIIINSRLTNQGDYATPEQGIPIVKPNHNYWELCYTMNDSWGFQPFDKKYKSSNQLIRALVDCIATGGNLLLDIGPKADGTIPQEQVKILKDIGRWTHKHNEAIYEVKPVESKNLDIYFFGKMAQSKDNNTLFLYLDYIPTGWILLDGVSDKINIESIKIVGHEQKLSYKKEGLKTWIYIPEKLVDKDITVVKIKFDNQGWKEVANTGSSSAFLFNKDVEPVRTIMQLIRNINSNPIENYNINVNKTNLLPDTFHPKVKKWIEKHAEVFVPGGSGKIDYGYFNGPTALSKDKQTLYLFVEGKPSANELLLKGVNNSVARIRIVGEGSILNDYTIYDKLYWSSTPGIIKISVPQERLDEYVTVIAVLLDKPIDLFRGEVKAIESNL